MRCLKTRAGSQIYCVRSSQRAMYVHSLLRGGNTKPGGLHIAKAIHRSETNGEADCHPCCCNCMQTTKHAFTRIGHITIACAATNVSFCRRILTLTYPFKKHVEGSSTLLGAYTTFLLLYGGFS